MSSLGEDDLVIIKWRKISLSRKERWKVLAFLLSLVAVVVLVGVLVVSEGSMLVLLLSLLLLSLDVF